ncbi:hypothetical protein A3F08_01440 [Candidatus Berkelbacteria bacterium RIFCSPHIGHO2_12_FULL_36_9]|uniref:30S ribosomal protein S21 n=1 Tax=Candidatus Berkelbacteria bacterium RIFCSPHIGHO2_12_FULL_36_9 TaxID=1797469 RepID=A0A1F5EK49_9BACT|nr:MAG: hypothetical protein A3F08_01440 [Candidatus Berkelbacteria bacterium RIFCSPHIGHO2_12_FULL_36_9]
MPDQRQFQRRDYNRGFQQSRREGGPGFEVLMRRFFREVQQSRILSEAKKRRHFSKDISRTEKRVIARRKAVVKRIKRGY